MATEVLIVAAEASSALFAKRLMQEWKRQKKQIHCFGVGTKDMEEDGFERLGKSEEMAVVGAAEIIESYSHLKAVFDSLVENAKNRKPKLAIVMDYPEFNLMLSKQLHKLGIPVVYYVSPQVWAWRKGRVETIKKYCKKVLLLFPFEVPFYNSKKVDNVFVGHPVLDELDPKLFTHEYQNLLRSQRGIGNDDIVLGIMPGSRRGEVKQHLEIQKQVALKMYHKFPRLKVLFMVAPTLDKEAFKEQIGEFMIPYIVIKDEPFRMIALTDIVLAASGTATLMVGLLQKPMVIMYRVKFLTGLFIRAFVRGVKYMGIVNLIRGKEVVPERFQSDANVDELTKQLSRYLEEPDHYKKTVYELSLVQKELGDAGATKRVVAALEEYLQ